jgi:hypothetical protein
VKAAIQTAPKKASSKGWDTADMVVASGGWGDDDG